MITKILPAVRGYERHIVTTIQELVECESPSGDVNAIDRFVSLMCDVLAPMARGVRLTTGAEFARRDAPSTPVQLEKCEPVARALLPGLRRAGRYLRGEIARALHLRYAPELHFQADEALDYAMSIDRLMRRDEVARDLAAVDDAPSEG